MREIVGAQIGTKITNRPKDIIQGLESGTITRFLSKREMQLMSACALGRNWDIMAASPVLFLLDEETGEVKPAGSEPPQEDFHWSTR